MWQVILARLALKIVLRRMKDRRYNSDDEILDQIFADSQGWGINGG